MSTQAKSNVVPLENREQLNKPMINVDYDKAIAKRVGSSTPSYPTRQESEEAFAEIYDMEIQGSIIDGEKHALTLQQKIIETYTKISGVDHDLPEPSAQIARSPEDTFKRLVSSDDE